MLFKRPGRRHLLLDEGCMEPGCLYIRLPPILHSLYIEGVIWPLAGVSEGIIELDPQSSLGNSPESLEILSQIDATIHKEHITIFSRDGGEQKFNPNICTTSTYPLTCDIPVRLILPAAREQPFRLFVL